MKTAWVLVANASKALCFERFDGGADLKLLAEFVEKTGKRAVIGSMTDTPALLAGDAGTAFPRDRRPSADDAACYWMDEGGGIRARAHAAGRAIRLHQRLGGGDVPGESRSSIAIGARADWQSRTNVRGAQL